MVATDRPAFFSALWVAAPFPQVTGGQRLPGGVEPGGQVLLRGSGR
jgi:hypothetical protein